MKSETIDSLKAPVTTEMPRSEIQEYCALTKELGISSPKARLEELRAFLAENGITVYPFDKVDAYLREKVKKETKGALWCWKPVRQKDARTVTAAVRRDPESDLRERLNWMENEYRRAMERGDRRTAEDIQREGDRLYRSLDDRRSRPVMNMAEMMYSDSSHGQFSPKVYPHAIPLPVLLTMKKISDGFPEAQFHASDYEVPRPDPFLAVMLPGTPDLFVIERWNEPGFRM